MKSSQTPPKKFFIENGYLATKKAKEGLIDFRKEEIHLAFADIDEQLAQLAKSDNISKVRRLITIQEIRNRLFELCSKCLYNLNVREFASHEPGSQTPLNGGC